MFALYNDRGCAVYCTPVKPSKVIHVLYIKLAFGRFHLWWSYETQRSICITFQKGVLQTGWQGWIPKYFKASVLLETEAGREYLFLKVVSRVLTFKRDSAHYTQHRHFAAITLILCQHLSHKQKPLEEFRESRHFSFSVDWFKFRD